MIDPVLLPVDPAALAGAKAALAAKASGPDGWEPTDIEAVTAALALVEAAHVYGDVHSGRWAEAKLAGKAFASKLG